MSPAPSSEHLYSTVTRVVAETIAVLLFFAVLVLQTVNILFRYTKIRAPEMWVEDFSKYALIWIFFLMWHLADRGNQHFAVDLLVQRLSPGLRRAIELFRHLAAIAFATVVIVSAVRFIPNSRWALSISSSPSVYHWFSWSG